jgi:hypothetical protein
MGTIIAAPMRIFRDPIWQVTILYAALTVLLAYPLTVHPASRTLSLDADTNLFMWALAWDAHAFVHQPLSIFDANIFYPARHTLAYSENFIGSAMVAAPVIWLTDNLVLAMNSVVLLSCVLCGTGTFLLARAVGISSLGSTIAGLVFAFSPPRFLRLDQLHLARSNGCHSASRSCIAIWTMDARGTCGSRAHSSRCRH